MTKNSNAKLPKGVRQIDEHIYEVSSSTQKGVKYTVDLDQMTCECKGFEYRRMCRHLKLLEHLKKWD